MKKILFFLACFAFVLVNSRSEAAGALGGKTQLTNTSTRPIFLHYVVQSPGVTWTFTTANLSAGADTVIHVQDANLTDGNFVAGNDDASGLASSVTVPPIATSRLLAVFVRSYNVTQTGTCTLNETSTAGDSRSIAVTLGGGVMAGLDDLVAGTHIYTAERHGGSNDTIVLAIGSNIAHAVGYDDDDGVGLMSTLHLSEACTSCQVLVANYSVTGPLDTALIWDQQAHTSDADGDGLGTTLESAIGTSDSNADSDQDGLSDTAELLGLDTSPPLKFPYMGADPTQKDMFVESDWQQCTDPTCNGNLDLGQLGWTSVAANVTAYTESIVQQIEADLSPVRVHVDLGRANTNSSTWTNWDNWGGATRGDYGASDIYANNLYGCEGASAERHNLFHFAVSVAPYTGHVNYLPGSCMVVTNNNGNSGDNLTPGRTFSHETGHTLGLYHGGRPPRAPANYKPSYFSLMNYAYQWKANAFSHGSGLSLNPTALDESRGVGPIGTIPLWTLKGAWCPNSVCVDLRTGAVDWNRDGVFSPSGTIVQGAVAVGDYAGQGHSVLPGLVFDAALSWVSVGGTVGDQLWIVGRGPYDNILQYARVSRTLLDSGCGLLAQGSLSDQAGAQATNCAGLSGGFNIPGNKVITTGPGLAEVGPGQLLVVWQSGAGNPIKANLISITSNTGTVSVGPDMTLPNSTTTPSDITAVATSPGVVTVWARAGIPNLRLKQWRYQNGTWSGPIDQVWSDGTVISPQAGIGATMGYQDNGATPSVYAAIPTAPSGMVEFARQGADGLWTKLSTWSDVGAQPIASGRPGLAYQRISGQISNYGRFYLAFNQASCTGVYGGSPCESKLMMTEGNLTSGSTRRLQWLMPARLAEPGMPGGVALLDDVTRDKNLRAMSNHINGTDQSSWFMPLADGIYNANLQDMDDYAYITGALRASLALDGGNWPIGVLPSSLP